ncbi:hypothetical protein CVT25_011361 [Psilocybe cyanescens]|uniref:Uncharacterized protein n=1 Tax=Psilocybe cyanescens TaxID=93625 RepID=A0A409WG90_PSICY|nr:hypothetical protein CVT25_011361 [Psilocybe cyanescens]
MSRSFPTSRRTASPHGSPPHKVYAMWSRIVDLSFIACFFLFARAFLFYDFGPIGLATGHSPSPNVLSADAPLYNGTSPSGLYHDVLPPTWAPAMATNLTNGDELGQEHAAYAQKSERRVLPSAADSSDDDDDATPDKEQVLTMAATGNKTPRMETSRTPSVLFSSNTRDRDLVAIESVTDWQDSDYNARDEYLASNRDPDPKTYAVQTITPKSRPSHSEDDYNTSNDEPFLSLEEYDGEREIFALKIWIDKKALQRARLGKTRYCQASSGIRCLSEG